MSVHPLDGPSLDDHDASLEHVAMATYTASQTGHEDIASVAIDTDGQSMVASEVSPPKPLLPGVPKWSNVAPAPENIPTQRTLSNTNSSMKSLTAEALLEHNSQLGRPEASKTPSVLSAHTLPLSERTSNIPDSRRSGYSRGSRYGDCSKRRTLSCRSLTFRYRIPVRYVDTAMAAGTCTNIIHFIDAMVFANYRLIRGSARVILLEWFFCTL